LGCLTASPSRIARSSASIAPCEARSSAIGRAGPRPEGGNQRRLVGQAVLKGEQANQ
jgi:hypothetical protein